eukprot:2233205-Pyramimonas_sp.AAC.2
MNQKQNEIKRNVSYAHQLVDAAEAEHAHALFQCGEGADAHHLAAVRVEPAGERVEVHGARGVRLLQQLAGETAHEVHRVLVRGGKPRDRDRRALEAALPVRHLQQSNDLR